jgi:hypothetical protein
MAQTQTQTQADAAQAARVRDELLTKAGPLTAAERIRLAAANAVLSRRN